MPVAAPEPARTILPAAPIVVDAPPAPRVARAVASAAVAASAPVAAAPAAAAAPVASAASAPIPTAAPPGAPQIAVSGGVYSPSPAQRLLVVNGQVFNEGSEVAPGVVLEQVQRGRAVLNFRGQRYSVPY